MKKVLALVLALILCVGLFAACTNGSSESNTPAGSGSSEATSAEFKWPLAERVEFKIWNGPMAATAGMLSPNDSYAYQEAEKRLNVHIEWDQPATGQENEQFSLIVASNIYPDAFFGGNYVGGLDKFVDDQIIIDMKPYLEQYAPNWMRLANITPDTWKKNVTDSGYIPAFYNISYEVEPTWWGPQVREDYLKDFGMNSLVTYDDWYSYLTRAKNEKNADRGYMMYAANGLDDNLLTGMGLKRDFYAVNGQIHFGPYEESLLDYLTMTNKWYKEGLIDADFMGRATSYFGDTQFIFNNNASAWHSFWTMFDIHKMNASDPNFQGVAVPVPVTEAGGTRKTTILGVPDSRVGTALDTITTQCHDIPTLVRWFDYFYSDEGEILADYGIEGLSYTLENGKPVLNDNVLNNPEGYSQSDCFSLYGIGSIHSRQYDWSRQNAGKSDYCLTAGKIWDSNWDMNAGWSSTQGMTLTADESAEYTPLINDINTYISETIVMFITGAKPLSEFDAYRAQLKDMGIERCIQIYQAAADRYTAR